MQRFSTSAGSSQDVKTNVNNSATPEKLLTSILGPFESYVVSIQSILIWEKPYLSAVAVTLANVLFWFGVYCGYRFYFVLISIAAIAFVYRTWIHEIWPEIRVPVPDGEESEEWTPVHLQVLSVPEISRYLSNMCTLGKNWYTWLANLRSEQPSSFFGLTMVIFSTLAFIGHHVPGVVIVYTLVMAVMLGPGFMLHVYPNLSRFLPSLGSLTFGGETNQAESCTAGRDLKRDCTDIDEFLPEANKENLEVLQSPLDVSRDEYTSTMFAEELGIDEMISNVPGEDTESNEIAELAAEFAEHDSSNESSQTDLLPIPVNVEAGQNEMKFISSHFDDTSEEEEIFQENLDFQVQEDLEESSLDNIIDDVPQCSLNTSHIKIAQEVDSVMAEDTSDSNVTESSDSISLQPSSSDHDFNDYVIISDSDL